MRELALDPLVIDRSDPNGPWPAEPAGALVLDLDGTIRCMPDLFSDRTPESQEVVPEVLHAAWMMRREGWVVSAATNQSAIGRGARSKEEVLRTIEVTDRLTGGLFRRFLVCPHAPGAGDVPTCACRKPRPGMLTLARDGQRRGLMVGDRPEDEAAARSAGFAFSSPGGFARRKEVPPGEDTIPRAPPAGTSAPWSFTWSSAALGAAHTARERRALEASFRRAGVAIAAEGLGVPEAVRRIAAVAWPVALHAAQDPALCWCEWFSVACAVGAPATAIRASIPAMERLLEMARGSSEAGILGRWRLLEKAASEP